MTATAARPARTGSAKGFPEGSCREPVAGCDDISAGLADWLGVDCGWGWGADGSGEPGSGRLKPGRLKSGTFELGSRASRFG
jgi:hypothetical protein